MVLAPASIAGQQFYAKRTLEARVAKLERDARIVQNTVYLKPSGILPLLLQTRRDMEQVESDVHGVRQDLQFCIRYRPDRTAVVNPTCFGFLPSN
jgi:hypothetical protein